MKKIYLFLLCLIVPVTSCNKDSAISTEKIENLKVGDTAPDFTTKGALAGNDFTFSLKEKLKDGPLVLYFFPKVFTSGCTAEANEFAEKTNKFKEWRASVIGMSSDDIEGLKKFSKEECRNKFAVANASKEIAKAYNVQMPSNIDMTNRTTFVIGTDGKIKMIYSDMDYKKHVELALEAVKAIGN